MLQNKKISLTLGGSVSNSFGKSAANVISGLDRIGKKEKQLKDSHALIGKLKADQLAIAKTSIRLKDQSKKLKELQQQYSKTEKPSAALRNKISKLQKQVNSSNTDLKHQRDNLKQVGQQLKRAGVDTANLTSEEKRLQRAIEKTQKQAQFKSRALVALGRTMKATKYAVLGVAGAMTAYGVAGYKMANNFAEHGDKIAKTADKLGISTTKLQELHYAAERSGVPINTLNMAMQRMERRVSQAAKGTGEAKAAIQELGLSAIELKELKPDQALGLIADKLEKVTNKQDKLRLAQKLFDSEGVALVNTLRGGSKELERLGKEGEKVGYILNEKALRAAENNRDAYLNMSTAMKGLGYTISATLMPKFTKLFTKVTRWITENRAQITSWIDKFSNAIGSLFTGLKAIGGTIHNVVKSTIGWENALKAIGVLIAASLFNKIIKLTSLFKGLFNVTKLGAKSLTSLGKGLSSAGKATAKATGSTASKVANSGKLLKTVKAVSKVGGVAASLLIPDTLGDGTLNTNQYNSQSAFHDDIMRQISAAKQQSIQNDNSKNNQAVITNNVTVHGNCDTDAIKNGVEQATQKALYDFSFGF